MKATKIASGFAVTALAAAVSMSASAAVEVNGDETPDGTGSWAGHVKFTSTYTLNSTQTFKGEKIDGTNENAQVHHNRVNDAPAGDQQLSVNFDVTEGPFSGNLNISGSHESKTSTVERLIVDDAGAPVLDDDGNRTYEEVEISDSYKATIDISGIEYDDGTFLFGDAVGSVFNTEGGITGLGAVSNGVNGAFRYYDNNKALGVVGLKVKAQLERPQAGPGFDMLESATKSFANLVEDGSGDDAWDELKDSVDTPYGVGVAFDFKKPGTNTQVMASVQYAENSVEGDHIANEALDPVFGVKIVDKSIPKTELTASFNSGTPHTNFKTADDEVTYTRINTYGVKAHFNAVKPDNGGFHASASFAESGSGVPYRDLYDNDKLNFADQTVEVTAGYILQEITDKTKKTAIDVKYTMQLVEDVKDGEATLLTIKAEDKADTLHVKLRQDFEYYYGQVSYDYVNEYEKDTLAAEIGNQSTGNLMLKAGTEVYMFEVNTDEKDGGNKDAVAKDADIMYFAELGYTIDAGNGIETGVKYTQKHENNKLLSDADAAKLETKGAYAGESVNRAPATELVVFAQYEVDGGAILRAEYENDNDSALNDDDEMDQFRDSLELSATYSF